MSPPPGFTLYGSVLNVTANLTGVTDASTWELRVLVDGVVRAKARAGEIPPITLAPGMHQVRVEVVCDSGLSVGGPDAVQERTVYAVAPGAFAPTLGFLNVRDGGKIERSSSGSLTVNVSLEGARPTHAFRSNGGNNPGEGYLVYALDNETRLTTAQLFRTFRNVTLGTHHVTVEFLGNDGRPLDPPVRAAATLDVVAYGTLPRPTPPTSPSPSPTGNAPAGGEGAATGLPPAPTTDATSGRGTSQSPPTQGGTPGSPAGAATPAGAAALACLALVGAGLVRRRRVPPGGSGRS